jgi:hypothetical protein
LIIEPFYFFNLCQEFRDCGRHIKLFVVVISLAVAVVVVDEVNIGFVVVVIDFYVDVVGFVDYVVGVVVIEFDVVDYVVIDFVDFSSFQRFRFSLEFNVSSRLSMFGENFDVRYVFLVVHCGLMPF